MRLITIQHKSVLDTLRKDGVYRAYAKFIPENLIEPYEFMMQTYQYSHPPIFLNKVGQRCEFYGASTGPDYIAIEFEIPDNLVSHQRYYDWVDFIYFTESPNEFPDSYNTNIFPTVKSFGKYVLTNTEEISKDHAYQFTVSELRAEWIRDIADDTTKLEIHNGSGGSYVLKPLSEYK